MSMTYQVNSLKTLILTTPLLLSSVSIQALAQESQGFMIEEIVVSAQRREQSLQDVPISVQAFSEDTLADAGVQSVHNLGSVTPGLNMTQQMSGLTPYIRGVGSPDASVGQESNVAIYIDGAYQANANAAIFSFNNIERIEVLKGPQGTLFGRNATGGLVQIISKDPSQERYVKGSVSYGNYDTTGAKLYATNGITDTIAADVAMFYSNQGDGYGDNLTLGTDINRSREKGIRTSWLFELSDVSELKVSADYSQRWGETGVHNAVYPGSTAIDGQVIFGGCVAGLGGDPTAPTGGEVATCAPIALAGATKAPDDWQDSYGYWNGWSEATSAGLAATYKHSFDSVDFTSITSIRDASLTNDFEQMASSMPLILIHIDEQSYKTYSQELQWAHSGETINWITGLYFYKDTSGFSKNGIQLSGLLVDPPQAIKADINTQSVAAFGEVVVSLRDTSRLTLGARVTRDERELEQDFYAGGAYLTSYSDDKTWTEPTWRLVFDQDIGDSTLAYASLSRGFKSGNYNVTAAPGSTPVNPEFIDALEIGLKTQLFDNRLQINMAAFTYDYTDMQVTRIETGSLVTVNAAEAEITGFEMDFLAYATENLQFKGGFSFVDSEYTKFEDAPAYTPSATGLGGNDLVLTNLSGQELARSPELTANLGATYDIGSVKLGINYYYNDGFNWEPSGRIKQDSYETVSASVSWRSPDDHLGIRLFGNNLTDEEYATFVTEQAVADNYEPAAPRTFGVEFSFEY